MDTETTLIGAICRLRSWSASAIPTVWMAAMLLGLAGCQTTGRIAGETETEARNILGRADPTGVLEMNRSIQQAAGSIRDQVRAIDTTELQACMAELRATIESLRVRIDALSPEDIETLGVEVAASLGAVRAQLDHVRLGDAIDGLTTLTRQIEAELKELDIEAANGLLAHASQTLTTVQTQVEPLAAGMNAAVERIRVQVDDIGRAVDALPLANIAAGTADLRDAAASIREVAASLPGVRDDVHRLLGTARVTLWIAAGAIAASGLGVIVRIIRGGPGRSRVTP